MSQLHCLITVTSFDKREGGRERGGRCSSLLRCTGASLTPVTAGFDITLHHLTQLESHCNRTKASKESAVHKPEILSDTSASCSTTPFSTAPIFLFLVYQKEKNTFCNCDFKRSINVEDYMLFNVVVCTIYMSTKMQ